MSLWSQRMREWVDCFSMKRFDERIATRLAAGELLARAVEDHEPYRLQGLGETAFLVRVDRRVDAALREYRARNPRQS